MNLEKEILKEHSKAQRDRIVAYVGSNSQRLSGLINIFLKGSHRTTQLASWPLSNVAEQYPELIAPHLRKIIHNLKTPDLHDAVKRNTIRLLQFVEIPKHLHGTIADLCFSFLQNPKEPIAVRVFSMTVLVNLSKKVPELKRELLIILEDQFPYEGPAYRSRARKILRELNA